MYLYTKPFNKSWYPSAYELEFIFSYPASISLVNRLNRSIGPINKDGINTVKLKKSKKFSFFDVLTSSINT